MRLRLRRTPSCARDEALLALLISAGLHVQEACDLQLRDLDLGSGTMTVRSGKAGKARRLPLHPDAERLLRRYLESVRCPDGLPEVQRVLGHSRLSTTGVYLTPSEEDLRSALGRAGL